MAHGSLLKLALATLLPLALPVPAIADVLVLDDGTVHVGELKRRSRLTVVFRTRVDGVWSDLTFEVDRIDKLFEDPGDQAAQAGAVVPERRPAEPEGVPAARPPDVVVIPLHGQIGGLIDGSVAGTFDAATLEHFLDRARDQEAAVVVLDLDSPGGYLSETESICQLIIDRSDEQRIVAFAGDALSGAAVIALCCRDIVVRPDARIGAAVMVQAGRDGLSAVEAKLASPHHARQRQFMEASGRPYSLLAAMTIQERELWWSPTAGFVDDPAAAARLDDVEAVDGATTVLTMLGDDAVRWGLARGAADDPGALAGILGLGRQPAVVDYAEEVRAFTTKADERVRRVLQQFQTYFQSLGAIHQTLTGGAGSGGVDRDDLRRQLGRAQRSARAIRRQDRRLMSSRTSIPEPVFDQLEDDTVALGEVAALVRDSERTSLDTARRRIEAILERWRRVMSF